MDAANCPSGIKAVYKLIIISTCCRCHSCYFTTPLLKLLLSGDPEPGEHLHLSEGQRMKYWPKFSCHCSALWQEKLHLEKFSLLANSQRPLRRQYLANPVPDDHLFSGVCLSQLLKYTTPRTFPWCCPLSPGCLILFPLFCAVLSASLFGPPAGCFSQLQGRCVLLRHAVCRYDTMPASGGASIGSGWEKRGSHSSVSLRTIP